MFYFLLNIPCDVGISSWAPWIPCIKCPEARISWGIGAGCWDPIIGFEEGSTDVWGGASGWGFMIFVIMLGGVSGIFTGWQLLGGRAVKYQPNDTVFIHYIQSSLPDALTLRFKGALTGCSEFVGTFDIFWVMFDKPAANDATWGSPWREAKFWRFWRVTKLATENRLIFCFYGIY